jgi:P27 family predicted phage terminase small subunit
MAETAPSHLSADSKRLWADLTDALDFDPADLVTLRLALEALDRCSQARRALKRHGITYHDRFGAPHSRPEVRIEAESRRAFAALVAQLDLPELDEWADVPVAPVVALHAAGRAS